MTRRRWIADTRTETTASLLGTHAEHLARVLRAQPGMQADVVVNGRVYRAAIESVSAEEVRFTLLDEIAAEPALPLTLLLAVFKFDRMEWAIEKSTELGVGAIVPVITRRTEKHLAQAAEKRVERWRRIAQEAAQQSRRADTPAIEAPVALSIALSARLEIASGANRILLAETERTAMLRGAMEAALHSVSEELPEFEFAVGPEGGWTEEELALFRKQGWATASLGPRILRAETAAIAAVAVAASLLTWPA
jgi:16S rRNA (uracil1498-N3)-methyltransferase